MSTTTNECKRFRTAEHTAEPRSILLMISMFRYVDELTDEDRRGYEILQKKKHHIISPYEENPDEEEEDLDVCPRVRRTRLDHRIRGRRRRVHGDAQGRAQPSPRIAQGRRRGHLYLFDI